MIWVLDFGSQYTQLIAKKLRRAGFQAEVQAGSTPAQLRPKNLKGVVLSGSPLSVGAPLAPDPQWLDHDIPILGLCFGYQWLAHHGGGELKVQSRREYGASTVYPVPIEDSQLRSLAQSFLSGFPAAARVWMSHGDSVLKLPPTLAPLLESSHGLAAFVGQSPTGMARLGLQFHPEVHHTENGSLLLENFAQSVCGMKRTWSVSAERDRLVEELSSKLQKVPFVHCAVSGGVDSTVLAVLLSQTTKVKALFVDHGFNRLYDQKDLESVFSGFPNIEWRVLDARELFWRHLKGVSDPELKRKTMGRLFIEVFEKELAKDQATYLAQGTIYSDVIESAVNPLAPAEKIKSHHNVGGLPETLNLKLLEPLRGLFKDEVRELGQALGIPKFFLDRHPFPGPGLAIRCLGPLSQERVDLVAKVDEVFVRELKARGLYEKIWQAAAILLPVQSVGVMGDGRSFESAVCLRAVQSLDAMTAEASEFSMSEWKAIASQIINEVRGVNRVVFDLTSKPPGTIEWE